MNFSNLTYVGVAVMAILAFTIACKKDLTLKRSMDQN